MEPETISEARDGIETAILLALSARNNGALMHRADARDRVGRERVALGAFCPRSPAYPRDAYTVEQRSDAGRLFASDPSGIVVDPVKAIGSSLETAMLCEDGVFKWSKLAPMPAPKGAIAVGVRRPAWFVHHFREIAEGRPDRYVKGPVAFDESGRVCLLKFPGSIGYPAGADRDEMQEQVCIMLTILEDARRSGAFLATVEEHTRLRFPVGAEAYLDFMRLRDAPKSTPSGRLNPILHWCKRHMRGRIKGEPVTIPRHLRGVDEISVGPMRLSIQPSPGYDDLLP